MQFDLLYEVVKSKNYSRKRTNLMKKITLATVNTTNENFLLRNVSTGTKEWNIFQNQKN